MNSASEHRSLLTIFAQTTPNDWLGGLALMLLLCASTCRGPLPQPHMNAQALYDLGISQNEQRGLDQ